MRIAHSKATIICIYGINIVNFLLISPISWNDKEAEYDSPTWNLQKSTRCVVLDVCETWQHCTAWPNTSQPMRGSQADRAAQPKDRFLLLLLPFHFKVRAGALSSTTAFKRIVILNTLCEQHFSSPDGLRANQDMLVELIHFVKLTSVARRRRQCNHYW